MLINRLLESSLTVAWSLSSRNWGWIYHGLCSSKRCRTRLPDYFL